MRQGEAFVVSDLLLGAGDSADLFLRHRGDAAFSAFVAALPAGSTLVLNGDVIDFVRVVPLETPEEPRHLLWNEPVSAFKLERVLRAHAELFEALRGFVERGGRVRFVVGDHDLDLAWPKLQERLRTVLTGRPEPGESVGFSLRRFVLGSVVIQHGHEYCDESRTRDPERFIHTWPNPRAPRDPAPDEYLERVWSSDFVLRVLYEIERAAGTFFGQVGPLHRLLLMGLKDALRAPRALVRPDSWVSLLVFCKGRALPSGLLESGLGLRADAAEKTKLEPEALVYAFEGPEWRAAIHDALADAEFRDAVALELERLTPSERALFDDAPLLFHDDTLDTAEPGTRGIFGPRRSWEERAALELTKKGSRTVVFGHRLSALDGALDGRLFAPGSYVPYLDITAAGVERAARGRGFGVELLRDESLYRRECQAVHIENGGEQVRLIPLASRGGA